MVDSFFTSSLFRKASVKYFKKITIWARLTIANDYMNMLRYLKSRPALNSKLGRIVYGHPTSFSYGVDLPQSAPLFP